MVTHSLLLTMSVAGSKSSAQAGSVSLTPLTNCHPSGLHVTTCSFYAQVSLHIHNIDLDKRSAVYRKVRRVERAGEPKMREKMSKNSAHRQDIYPYYLSE